MKANDLWRLETIIYYHILDNISRGKSSGVPCLVRVIYYYFSWIDIYELGKTRNTWGGLQETLKAEWRPVAAGGKLTPVGRTMKLIRLVMVLIRLRKLPFKRSFRRSISTESDQERTFHHFRYALAVHFNDII